MHTWRLLKVVNLNVNDKSNRISNLDFYRSKSKYSLDEIEDVLGEEITTFVASARDRVDALED